MRKPIFAILTALALAGAMAATTTFVVAHAQACPNSNC
jgi:Prokaryotic membrane lipoprotein lipid attachment site